MPVLEINYVGIINEDGIDVKVKSVYSNPAVPNPAGTLEVGELPQMSTSQGTFTPPRRAVHTTETRTIVDLSIDKAAKSFKAAVFAPKGDDPAKRLATIRERAVALLNCHTNGQNSKSGEILRKAGRLARKNRLPDDITNLFPTSTN